MRYCGTNRGTDDSNPTISLHKRIRALGQLDFEHQSLIVEVMATRISILEATEIHIPYKSVG